MQNKTNTKTIVITTLITIVILLALITTITQKQPIDLTVGWFGVGDDYKLWRDIDTALQVWSEYIVFMKQWRFNTVRLAFRFPSVVTGTHSILVYEDMDRVIGLFAENGIKVILDCHNWEDMYNFFGSQEWIDSWVELAERYKNDDRIVAYELFNEPFRDTWHFTVGSSEYGVLKTYLRCIDAVRQAGDQHTIILTSSPLFMDNYLQPESIPNEYLRDNIVVTHHAWFFEDRPMGEVLEWDRSIVEIWVKAGWDVWIGETGMLSKFSTEEQRFYLLHTINLSIENHIGFNIWLGLYNQEEISQVLEASNYSKLLG